MEERNPSTTSREFDLVLVGIPELTDHVADALYEAGCDDATISKRSGRVYLTFDREGASLRNAVISAIRDVRKAGFGRNLRRVDTCELVTQSEIARRIQRSRQQVHQYVSGSRGPGDFPAPVCDLKEGHPLYRWCEVTDWLFLHGIVEEDVYVESRDIDLINTILSLQFQQKHAPDATVAISAALAETEFNPVGR